MKSKQTLLMVALALSAWSTQAQVVPGAPLVAGSSGKPVFEGVTLFERVSRDELNRLSIIDGRIKKMHFKTEELEVVDDKVNGQAFFTPKTDKTISVFVTTQRGATFTLVMQPIPKMPAVNLTVQESQSAGEASQAAEKAQKAPAPSALSAMSFEQAITTLIYAAATAQSLPGVSEQAIQQAVPLWQGTSFTHLRTLQAASLQLAEYRLANVSQKPLRLVEQEFYKPGVLGVAVEQHLLDPGESTPVFIVQEVKR